VSHPLQERIVNDVFTFGKYKGKNWLWVFVIDPGYIVFLIQKLDDFFIDMIENYVNLTNKLYFTADEIKKNNLNRQYLINLSTADE